MLSDDESAAPPALVHAGFILEQAPTHFNAVMTEKQLALPMSVFRLVQEDKRYNLCLLDEQ